MGRTTNVTGEEEEGGEMLKVYRCVDLSLNKVGVVVCVRVWEVGEDGVGGFLEIIPRQ